MICDICNGSVTETTAIPLAKFQQSVRSGFNPFKMQGIDASAAVGQALIIGLTIDQIYQDWRNNVLSDMTDWRLCDACLAAYERVATGGRGFGNDRVGPLLRSSTGTVGGNARDPAAPVRSAMPLDRAESPQKQSGASPADESAIVRFRCPNPKCKRALKAPADSAGQKEKCPKCGTRMIIPTRSEVKPTDKTLRDKLPSTHQEAIIDHPLTNESAAPLVIPTIRIGMDEQSVERLLGSPRARRRGSDILQRLSAQFGIMGITEGEPGLLASQTERDFAIYDHPEGQYNVVYLNGKVVEVHRQPFP